MRGFVVLFDTEPQAARPADDPLLHRLQQWTEASPPGQLLRDQLPGCSIYRYSSDAVVPAGFNQHLAAAPGSLTLWTGPRVDLTPQQLLAAPANHRLPEQVQAAREASRQLDSAICVSYRADTHSLQVRTDGLASTAIYWLRSGRWLLLSNASLMLARLARCEVDAVAASEFLASGSIYGNRGLYAGVRSLPPASVMAFGAGKAEPVGAEYWPLHELPFGSLSLQQARDQIIAELDQDFAALDATGRHFIADLTGGYDSRTNLGFALRKLKRFETTVSGTPQDEDVVLSSQLAGQLGLKHTVIAPPADDDGALAARLDAATLATDLEYDIVEYARIYHAQTRFDQLRQPSIHGSIGDIARNYLLRPEFCSGGPEGGLVVEPLIAQRFRSLIPAAMGRPGLPIAQWEQHMRERIALHDRPELPVYARLDILYLRMRMQFWQGRIASSTNRYRASFSPFVNRRVVESMLCPGWRERDHQMLSRVLLKALHPGLGRVVVSRGAPAGPGLLDVMAGLPTRMRYYASRVAVRLGRVPATPVAASATQLLWPGWEQTLAPVLRDEAIAGLTQAGGLASQPQVFGRLMSLSRTRRLLDTWPPRPL